MTKSQGPGAGKYAKKADVCGEAKAEGKVASHLPYLGVRTRAKTLALNNLKDSSPESTSSYLQLRNRRLVKHSCSSSSARSRAAPKSRLNVCPSRQIGRNKVAAKRVFVGRASLFSKKVITEVGPSLETSVGENVLDANRSDRETTPSSLIRNSEAIENRGSTTRPTDSTANKWQQLPIASSIPSPSEVEMERFFARPEQLQQRRFMEKYNFDVVNDKPLPGRYEWVKLDSSLCRQTKRRRR